MNGPTSPPLLSKSKYMLGLQCVKQLWIHYHQRELLPPVEPATQAVFDQGHEVGAWAKHLFPGGIDLNGTVAIDAALALTEDALREGRPVFEAAIRHGRCLSRADILDPAGDGNWDLIEVKSSTMQKEEHLQDVAFQLRTCEGAGLRIRRCFLLLINTEYVRNGLIDPSALFQKIDVTEEARALLPAVALHVEEMLRVIAHEQCPEVRIGPHCQSPYDCPLQYHCWAFLPKPNIFDLRGGGKKAWTLFDAGVLRMEDIPADFKLSGAQAIEARCHRTGEPHVDVPGLRSFLAQLQYPLQFLDFETFQPAVPPFDRSRPYGQIPFQFSLHVVPAQGAAPIHYAFLAEEATDPRPAFLAELRRRIGGEGSIVAYNTAFETGRLRECAEFFPDFQPWAGSLLPRFVDLFAPFRSGLYYHLAQHGSASLKAVLPVLTGTGYDALEIHDGGTASREFLRVTFGNVPADERARVRTALERYCSQDTQAMIDIVAALTGICGPR